MIVSGTKENKQTERVFSVDQAIMECSVFHAKNDLLVGETLTRPETMIRQTLTYHLA